jgi:hypothetical protein
MYETYLYDLTMFTTILNYALYSHPEIILIPLFALSLTIYADELMRNEGESRPLNYWFQIAFIYILFCAILFFLFLALLPYFLNPRSIF